MTEKLTNEELARIKLDASYEASDPMWVEFLRQIRRLLDEHAELTKRVDKFEQAVIDLHMRARLDDPSLDGTPNAHPAFWRGYTSCVDDVEESNQFDSLHEARIHTVMYELVDSLRAAIPKMEPKT